ncbi:hypothetical protein GQ54DRAFT_177007 [Martensiomyces pterosporus]|nr:hypothetical protein GQ54DRAFT_177007 [Martensiomyces pterosporus]
MEEGRPERRQLDRTRRVWCYTRTAVTKPNKSAVFVLTAFCCARRRAPLIAAFRRFFQPSPLISCCSQSGVFGCCKFVSLHPNTPRCQSFVCSPCILLVCFCPSLLRTLVLFRRSSIIHSTLYSVFCILINLLLGGKGLPAIL